MAYANLLILHYGLHLWGKGWDQPPQNHMNSPNGNWERELLEEQLTPTDTQLLLCSTGTFSLLG